MLAYYTRKCIGRLTFADLCPGVFIIGGFIQTWSVVVELISGCRYVSSCFVMWGYFNGIYQTFFQSLWRYVFPVGTTVSSQIDKPIVTAGPNHSFFMR